MIGDTMKTKKIGMKNTYTIYKMVDGERRELAQFSNLITDSLKKALATYPDVKFHSVWFGDGNKVPAESDTALSHPCWTFDLNHGNIIALEPATISDDDTWNVFFTARIDASAAFVGTVTELGIYYTFGGSSYIYLGTHALIKDAEGNPMTITKEDTEELLVDVHVQYQLGGGTDFEWLPWYRYVMRDTYSSLIWPHIPSLGYIRIVMMKAYPDLMSNGDVIGSRQAVTQKYDATKHVLTISQGRFLADNSPTQEYVNAVGIVPAYANSSYDNYQSSTPIGIFRFPNPEIFPNTTLSEMQVGVGDGETKEFIPPLNLWVKNTERIYIDGELKVRDVDYTCDHRNNLSNLSTLHASLFCELKNEIIRPDTVENGRMGYHPLKGGFNGIPGNGNLYVLWDNDHPLEWELKPDPQIGIEADYFQMESVRNTAGQAWKNAVFTLSYSVDGEEWIEAGTYKDTTGSNTYESYRFDFPETVSAKHWRLSIDVSGCVEKVKTSRFYAGAVSYLGRNGSPICFDEAPVAGAIITMDADIDRPMKNNNFILDVNPTFSL